MWGLRLLFFFAFSFGTIVLVRVVIFIRISLSWRKSRKLIEETQTVALKANVLCTSLCAISHKETLVVTWQHFSQLPSDFWIALSGQYTTSTSATILCPPPALSEPFVITQA